MPCQPYKDALVEAAASGAEPVAELRAHFSACADCRSAFELERSLFASIDSGLRLTANAEVPASLFPRIRARLDETPAPAPFWSANWLVFASAAALLFASFTAYSLWRTHPGNESPVARTNSPSVPVKPLQSSPAPAPPSLEKQFVSSPRNTLVAHAPIRQPRAELVPSTPEVLVPHSDEVLLTNYAQQWRQRKQLLLVAEASADAENFPLLQVSPIQIPDLDVKPLAEKKSQESPQPQANRTTASAVQEEVK